MSYQPLPIGVDNFKDLITEGYYFIDKTLLVRDLLEKKSKVNLFTRPRRFGKTLNMSMLRYFFEDARDDEGNKKDNRALFDGLNIMQAGEKYLSHMGQYPVISISLKEAEQPEFDLMMPQMYRLLAKEFKRHSFVMDSLNGEDRARFQRIKAETGDRTDYSTALEFLSACLEKYYGKQVIILIDEYDVPLREAHACGFYDKLIPFLRTLFSSALKTNDSLAFAVMTGCLRISKESIFTGLNNLRVISILTDSYDEYFGFTEAEVEGLCKDYGMPERYESMKEWYNGYVFGSVNIYNPWSIINYMADLTDNPKRYPKVYWGNTSSNDVIRKLIALADDDIKEDLETLILDGTVEKPVHEDITYDEVYKTAENLWNFLFFTGYLRKVSERLDENNTCLLTLTIPNKEVKWLFQNKIMEWFREQVKTRDMSILQNAVIGKDVQIMEEELNDILLSTISYMDENESYYHGILAGLLTGTLGYRVKSNREGGTGRSDLLLLPVSRRKEAFVFEFKKAGDIDDLEEKAEEALAQIDEKKYREEVYGMGYKMVSRYGIAFCGKECLVKWQE